MKIQFTGPQEQTQIRFHSPYFWMKIFQRWGPLVEVPEEFAEHLLRIPGFIEKGFSLRAWLKKNPGKQVEIIRISALGDVLQLLLAINDDLGSFKNRVRIRTQDTYANLVRHYFPSSSGDFHPELILNFDGLVEQDTSNPDYIGVHRIDIFRDHLEIPRSGFPRLCSEDNSSFWESSSYRISSEKYWVMNYRGSRVDNSLDPEIVDRVVEKLRTRVNLYVLGGKGSHPHDLDADLDYPTLFKIVAGASLSVVTDSGLLWVSHFTHTPVLGMFRTAPYSARMTYAPPGSSYLELDRLDSSFTGSAFSGDPERLADEILKSQSLS